MVAEKFAVDFHQLAIVLSASVCKAEESLGQGDGQCRDGHTFYAYVSGRGQFAFHKSGKAQVGECVRRLCPGADDECLVRIVRVCEESRRGKRAVPRVYQRREFDRKVHKMRGPVASVIGIVENGRGRFFETDIRLWAHIDEIVRVFRPYEDGTLW